MLPLTFSACHILVPVSDINIDIGIGDLLCPLQMLNAPHDYCIPQKFFFHFIEYFYIFLSNCPLAFHEILYQEYKQALRKFSEAAQLKDI